MQTIPLDTAVKLIRQECAQSEPGHLPFFFVAGAGISSPPLPLSWEVRDHCRTEAQRFDQADECVSASPLDIYSHWFQRAYPAPIARQRYLRNLIHGKPISEANLRLAHALLSKKIATTVVTPNFDDFLSRALTLFGQPHIICDHPQTSRRIDPEAANDLQIVHVHGSYWFYDCCNLTTEIAGRAEVARDSSSTMSFLLDSILRTHSPIVLGYSGWENDVIMSALRRRLESMLPHNAYWFCYRAEEAERLPAWLKEHRNMFMVKEAADKELPAKAVLDAMNRAFDLESPLLAANPLEFFAKHLRDSLLDSTDDVYAIRSVIERLERARDTENIVGGTVESQMERVRDAIRRSDYDSALQAALHLDLSALAAEALEELRQHIVERMPWTSNVQAFELVRAGSQNRPGRT